MENEEPLVVIVDAGELSIAPESVANKLIMALQRNGDQFRFLIEVRGREKHVVTTKNWKGSSL